VLTRKTGEQLVIAGNITVKVVRVDGDRVKLGITAPDDVSIHRQEVFDRIHQPDAAPPNDGKLQ
jgi:carbon storage regulator